jgi:hypothetical protein
MVTVPCGSKEPYTRTRRGGQLGEGIVRILASVCSTISFDASAPCFL